MRVSGLRYNDRSVYDGLGDGGERFQIVVTTLAERGWSDAEIDQAIASQRSAFAVPPDWNGYRIRQEMNRCIAKVRPLETKPAAEVEQTSDDGLPGWLRDRIESTAIPADRDAYFREVVAALADRDWDSQSIAVAIAGRAWIPERYAGRHLVEWGIKPVVEGQPRRRALIKSPGLIGGT